MTTNGPWISYGYNQPYLMGAVGSGTSSTSTVLTFSTAAPGLQDVGCAIIVGVSDQVPSTIKDNYGLAYIIHAVGTASTSGVWVAKPILAQNYIVGNSITITWAAASTQHSVMALWVQGAQWNDVVSFGGSSGSGTAASVTTTPLRGDELMFAIVGAKTGAASTSVNWGSAIQPTPTRNGTADMISLAYVPMTGQTTTQTATATLSASATWYMSAFCLRLIRPNPVVPPLNAGQLVHASDLNQLSYNANFFNNPPCACGLVTIAAQAGQATAGAGGATTAPGTSSSTTFDNDGFGGMPTNPNTAWIITRPGYYEISFSGTLGTSGVGTLIETQTAVTAGQNNPNFAPGSSQFLAGTLSGASGISSYSGVNCILAYTVPFKLYPGDQVAPAFWNASTVAAAGGAGAYWRILWIGTDNNG